MRSLYPLSILALTSLLSAQGGVVSPAHFTNAEGPSNNNIPFGTNVQTYRYQGIHSDLQGMPMLIKGLGVRRNGTSTGSNAAHTQTLSAWCSNAATASTAPSTTFDNNHGAGKAQVVTNKTFNHPQSDYGFVPTPFEYDMPFDTPYPFTATSGLCWEVQITAKTNATTFQQDAMSGTSANPPMAISRFGAGCKVTGQAAAMAATGTASANWPAGTGTITITGTAGPANSAVFVLVGLSSTSFGGIPLPFLLPGSATAPSGPCSLYTDIVLATAATTSATGGSTTTIPVPMTPDLNGLRSFSQILAPDPMANPIGLALSNAVNHNWVAPYAAPLVARVWLANSLGPTGSAGANFALIVRFSL